MTNQTQERPDHPDQNTPRTVMEMLSERGWGANNLPWHLRTRSKYKELYSFYVSTKPTFSVVPLQTAPKDLAEKMRQRFAEIEKHLAQPQEEKTDPGKTADRRRTN